MRLSAERVQHLEPADLPRVVTVFGDEPLTRGEVEDRLRFLARAAGVTERIVHTVTSGFDWSALAASGQAMSLFGDRRLIEIYSEKAAWGRAGGDALKAIVADAKSPDCVLVRCGALDRRQQSSAWFKALDQAGAVIETRPVRPHELARWLSQRAQRHGLRITTAAAELIAERVEGNLLAASQEVEKLALIAGDGNALDVDDVIANTTDSARFDSFEFVDSAIAGDSRRALRVLASLRAEGIEPLLVNWALQTKLRNVAALAERTEHGEGFDQACEALKIWRNQRGALKKALASVSLERSAELLAVTRRLDRIIKGADPDYGVSDPWRVLAWLTLALGSAKTRVTADLL